MEFHPRITAWLIEISYWFLAAHDEVETWVFPFNLLAGPLYSVYWAFDQLAFWFWEWQIFTHDLVDTISHFLTAPDIYLTFKWYFDKAVGAWNWIQDVWNNILPHLIFFWEAMRPTVEGWIGTAIEWVSPALDQITATITTLQTAWDSFVAKIPTLDEIIAWFSDWWARILSPLTNWWNERLLEVNTLVDSILRSWFPFYDTLVELWDTITAFFVSPLDWLLDQFTDWFLGPEG